MKHIQRAQIISLHPAAVYNDGRRTSLSEQKLVSLHKALLSAGFHLLRDVSREELFLSIQTISQFAPHHRGVIIADADQTPVWRKLKNETIDLVVKESNLNQLLLYDFIIIDGTQKLLGSSWFAAWEEYITVRNLSDCMPVIMIV